MWVDIPPMVVLAYYFGRYYTFKYMKNEAMFFAALGFTIFTIYALPRLVLNLTIQPQTIVAHALWAGLVFGLDVVGILIWETLRGGSSRDRA